MLKTILEIGTRLSIITAHLFALESLVASEGVKGEAQDRFRKLSNADWQEVFFDPCTENWQKHWTLDGLKATIHNSEEGMDFSAGPVPKEDASHAVLWTKAWFGGDLKIEYEYSRTNKERRYVTILYIQATGNRELGFPYDIAEWADQRTIPAMRTYYRNMDTYHISYAAFGADPPDQEYDYIRARRYMPIWETGLQNTELPPDDYERTGLFETGITHHVTVIKKEKELFMFIRNPEKEYLGHWKNAELPGIQEGRIGLRHMFTRSARYRNFRISTLKE